MICTMPTTSSMGLMVNSCIATGVGKAGAGKAGTVFVSGLSSDWQPASKARPASVM
jgi:hypothetical protein